MLRSFSPICSGIDLRNDNLHHFQCTFTWIESIISPWSSTSKAKSKKSCCNSFMLLCIICISYSIFPLLVLTYSVLHLTFHTCLDQLMWNCTRCLLMYHTHQLEIYQLLVFIVCGRLWYEGREGVLWFQYWSVSLLQLLVLWDMLDECMGNRWVWLGI